MRVRGTPGGGSTVRWNGVRSGNAKAHSDFLQGLSFPERHESGGPGSKRLPLGDRDRRGCRLCPGSRHARVELRQDRVVGAAPPRQTWPKAIAAASKALELDESIAAAHAAIGSARAAGEWNWPKAEREFARALETGGDDAVVHQAYAVQYLVPGKRFDEALVEEMLLAVERTPNALEAWSNLGWVQFCDANTGRRRRGSKNVLAGQPDYVPALSLLARAYGQLGSIEKALSTLQIAADVSGRDPSIVAFLGLLLPGQLGDVQQAEQARREKSNRSPAVSRATTGLSAMSMIGLGHQEEAIEKAAASCRRSLGTSDRSRCRSDLRRSSVDRSVR